MLAFPQPTTVDKEANKRIKTKLKHLVGTIWGTILELGDIRRFHFDNQINTFIGIDLRHYKSGNFLAKEHITKRGNPYARKILFKCIHNIALASYTNPCHIADFYEKRKRQSQVTSTKPHTSLTMELRLWNSNYFSSNTSIYLTNGRKGFSPVQYRTKSFQ